MLEREELAAVVADVHHAEQGVLRACSRPPGRATCRSGAARILGAARGGLVTDLDAVLAAARAPSRSGSSSRSRRSRRLKRSTPASRACSSEERIAGGVVLVVGAQHVGLVRLDPRPVQLQVGVRLVADVVARALQPGDRLVVGVRVPVEKFVLVAVRACSNGRSKETLTACGDFGDGVRARRVVAVERLAAVVVVRLVGRERDAVEQLARARVVAHDEQDLVLGAVVRADEPCDVDARRPGAGGGDGGRDGPVRAVVEPGRRRGRGARRLRGAGQAREDGVETAARAAVVARSGRCPRCTGRRWPS